MLEIMMNELKMATKDFFNMTGIKIVLYDDTRKLLYSHPDGMCSFCKTVRKSPALAKKCYSCDKVGFDACDKTKKPHIYHCHMELLEAITPIYENDTLIGYMMMGQILQSGETDRVRNAIKLASELYGANASELNRELLRLRSVSSEFIHSALNVMSMCVCYLYTNRIIRSKSEDLPLRLRDYAERYYAEPLSVPALCQKLYISKSKLYHLSKQAFGMGISDYIRTKRIEKAKELLRTSEKTVVQIAEAVGFEDANYFTRCFKQQEHLTPKEYRKQFRAEQSKNCASV